MSLTSPLSNQFMALASSVKSHEGLRLKTYLCPMGKPTIGFGKNLMELEITEVQATKWLHEDMQVAVNELDRVFPGWRNHSEARQNVLIEACYQLGAPTFAKFTKFWAAMSAQDYPQAALELLASRWASQTPKRVHTLARRLEEDKFQ
jgi:lysozyme